MSTTAGAVSVPAEDLDRLQTHAIAAMRAGSLAWHASRSAGALEAEAQAKEARERSRAVVRSEERRVGTECA